ncbi:Uncharacterized conserved protein [Devosia sp. YR412]|uniref:exopolysaccharide biosynthesis protein n=1 Tax=Devosia sp. YR412 TaxID=1881030 RepID=UPI0008B1CBA6|nr:exopolysaccharide biosynthesis protein [Devosia sp. YR412]SEQ41384.1 Uncharacterized conserved protein [Devosia sp. YR412]
MTDTAAVVPTPLEAMVAGVLQRIRAMSENPEARLSCNGLIAIIGPDSHVLAILIFAVLNLLPGPPGYSLVVGLAIMAFAVMLLARRPLRLWAFVGERQIPLPILVRLLEFLAGFTRLISKFSRPRASALASPRLLPMLAVLAFGYGFAMLVPIPFTNTLPSLGLAITCVGMLNRDGLAVLLGTAIAMIGVVLLVLVSWVLLTVLLVVSEVVQQELPAL